MYMYIEDVSTFIYMYTVHVHVHVHLFQTAYSVYFTTFPTLQHKVYNVHVYTVFPRIKASSE